MKVTIAGHWQTDIPAGLFADPQGYQPPAKEGCSSSTSGAPEVTPLEDTAQTHAALAQGILAHDSDVNIETLPFGGGPDFAASLADVTWAGTSPAPVGVSIPRDCSDATDIGRQVSALIAQGSPVAVEAGHCDSPTLWASFLDGALGRSGESPYLGGGSLVIDEATLAQDVETLADLWGAQIPVFACSTQRPLVGLSSVMAVAPDLASRHDTDPQAALKLRNAMTAARQRRTPALDLLGQQSKDPASTPGSGAGGGVAALIATMGGFLRETGAYLAAHMSIPQRLAGTDLLIVTEPFLHSPLLAEGTLDALTAAAAEEAIPVLAVGIDSSLSRYELAQWGIHGSLLAANTQQALHHLGQRIVHTWIRRRR